MAQGTCSIEGCAREVKARGWCKMHWQRWSRTGTPHEVDRTRPAPERFWPKVNKTETCWLWTGATNLHGYGRFVAVTGPSHSLALAHRWSYEHLVGLIPDGLVLDHLCRTPACVRPEHLEPVTNAENIRRGMGGTAARERAARQTHCKSGHEFTEANTYTYTRAGGYPMRGCRICRSAATARSRTKMTTTEAA